MSSWLCPLPGEVWAKISVLNNHFHGKARAALSVSGIPSCRKGAGDISPGFLCWVPDRLNWLLSSMAPTLGQPRALGKRTAVTGLSHGYSSTGGRPQPLRVASLGTRSSAGPHDVLDASSGINLLSHTHKIFLGSALACNFPVLWVAWSLQFWFLHPMCPHIL